MAVENLSSITGMIEIMGIADVTDSATVSNMEQIMEVALKEVESHRYWGEKCGVQGLVLIEVADELQAAIDGYNDRLNSQNK